ncbi:MAG: dihydropteroate synthase [Actinobacteria bacterium]|nr:dihydropteroate synthase [Actinomycetota bacterium]
MGILNVTPDSFADGGRHFSIDDAIAHANQMIAEGVDIIDIGGESTRPGAQRVTPEEEAQRVIPVLEEVVNLGIPISVDTTRAHLAEQAIARGAQYINDVSGGLADLQMARVIAERGVKYIAMHWRAHSAEMMNHAEYEDVVSDVKGELQSRVDSLQELGVLPEQLIIDPGIGFSKEAAHNWELLRGLDQLAELGFPILVGASRKRFLGEHLKPEEREDASIAVTSFCAAQGVWAVRTHSVRAHKAAIAQVAKLKVN